MNCLRLVVLVSTVAFLSGCAFSISQVPIGYSYNERLSLEHPVSKSLAVGDVKDSRNIDNPKLIVHKRNEAGNVTTGGYEAEKPLSEIIRDGLNQGLIAAAIPTSSGSCNFTLYGELMDFSNDLTMGLWKATLNSKLTVKLRLRDNANNTVIWGETLMGKAREIPITGIPGITGDDHIKDGFAKALNDLIRQLYTDEAFLEKLR